MFPPPPDPTLTVPLLPYTPLFRSDRIRTVTAISDNAGAFSVPAPGYNEIPEGVDTDMLARAAMDSVASPVEVPTGNGFCLYIKRDLIDAIGLFDEASFPEGYGEENDFCMRALAAGWYKQHGRTSGR